MTFGEKLMIQRKQAGLTQKELAERAGVSRNSIINWETGKREPRGLEDFAPLAEVLNCSIADLMPDDFSLVDGRTPDPEDADWKHVKKIMEEAKVFFAGAKLPEKDRLQFMLDIQEIYWEGKRQEEEEKKKR